MAELRLENTDGEYLLLSLPTGESHRLLIDEALRKAVRREAFPTDDSNLISPREIQLEVRAGVTIEDLVSKTGASLEYIQKFAAPVIDELAHVVKSALSVRITMAGDRYAETTQVEFGDVVANRLANQGVVSYQWSARKSDNGGWQVTCKHEGGSATWAFDARKLALSPENELAVQLSTQQSLTEAPLPRLRSVMDIGGGVESAGSTGTITLEAPRVDVESEIAPVTQLISLPSQESLETPEAVKARESVAEVVEPPVAQAKVTPITPVWEQPVQPSELSKPRQPAQTERIAPVANITADLGQTVEFEGVVPFGRSTDLEAAPASASAESLANTADLLDALRRRRLEREQDVLSTATGAIDLSELPQFDAEVAAAEFDGVDEPAPETAPVNVVDFDEAPVAEAEKPKKPTRQAMPSWDEIVFNNRNDD